MKDPKRFLEDYPELIAALVAWRLEPHPSLESGKKWLLVEKYLLEALMVNKTFIDAVNIPKTENEAKMMIKLGCMFLGI